MARRAAGPARSRHDPAALARHYSRAGVADRLALTGHSHQAWPDVALDGQTEAFDDAAALLDEKWDRALAKADRVRSGLSRDARRRRARPARRWRARPTRCWSGCCPRSTCAPGPGW